MKVLIFFSVIFACKLNAQSIEQIISFINKDRSAFEDYAGVKNFSVKDDEVGKDYTYFIAVGNKEKQVHIITSFNIIKKIWWFETDNYFDLWTFNNTYLIELKKFKFLPVRYDQSTYLQNIYTKSIREFIVHIKEKGNPSYHYITYLANNDTIVYNYLTNENYLIMIYDSSIFKKEKPKVDLKNFRDNILKPRIEK